MLWHSNMITIMNLLYGVGYKILNYAMNSNIIINLLYGIGYKILNNADTVTLSLIYYNMVQVIKYSTMLWHRNIIIINLLYGVGYKILNYAITQ